jgi:hypothetical protein
MTTYKIVRNYFNAGVNSRTIETGLTLEEAQAHCGSDESSSRTATGKEAKARTRRVGAWFDGYTLEK